MNMRRYGFTIVELLLIIVVVAILAVISVVTYTNLTRRTENTSVATDIAEIDRAQRTYIALNGAGPIAVDGDAPDELIFSANPGNTVVVRLGVDNGYCIYGYNPRSDHPTFETASIRAVGTSEASCVAAASPPSSDSFISTASIIGERLEQFYQTNGYYPHLDELSNIGLIIKPNSDNAFQQQLYCRNDARALYLQIEGDVKAIYVYETDTKTVTIPTDVSKTSLDTICPAFDINEGDAGYESTGIKSPDM